MKAIMQVHNGTTFRLSKATMDDDSVYVLIIEDATDNTGMWLVFDMGITLDEIKATLNFFQEVEET